MPLSTQSTDHPGSFANRQQELQKISRILRSDDSSGPRLEVWRAGAATGFSAFLRHSAKLNNGGGRAIYVDCSITTPNSIFSQLIVALFNSHNDLWRQLNAYIAKRSGSGGTRELTVHALGGLPWVGPALVKAGEELTPRIELSHYPSAIAEIVCEFLLTLSDRERIAILLDNVQEIEDWSLDLLRSTVGRPYRHLSYLFGVVRRPHLPPAKADELLSKALGGFYVPRYETFSDPDELFVKALANVHDVPISASVATAIATAADGNIYRILRTVGELKQRDAPKEPLPGSLSPAQRKMVHSLLVARQPLRFSDLATITALSPAVYFGSPDEIHTGVQDLAQHGLVSVQDLPDGDYLLELATTSLPVLAERSEAEDIGVASELYEHFRKASKQSSRHSQAEVAPLLYRLSKVVDADSTPHHTRALLRLSLQMGAIEPARRLIDLATEAPDLQSCSLQDFIVKVSFFLSVRAYKKGLRLVQSPPSPAWLEVRPTKILHAIALNRCRQHEQAGALMTELLDNPAAPEEISLLASFLMSGYLHEDRVDKAQETFHKYREPASVAKNYGYFLRNAASAFVPPVSLELLERAVATFDEDGDRFGWATSLSNLAVNQARTGEIELALNNAEAAAELLETFGIYHLHIVMNNVGCILLSLKRFQEAHSVLIKARSLARTTMPRLLQTINLSGCLAMMGNEGEAVSSMRKLLPQVVGHPIDRVRQLYYLNAAAIEVCTQKAPARLQSLLTGAREYRDRHDPQESLRRADALEELAKRPFAERREALSSAFSACFLAYWYQNPLEALPPNILSLKAQA